MIAAAELPSRVLEASYETSIWRDSDIEILRHQHRVYVAEIKPWQLLTLPNDHALLKNWILPAIPVQRLEWSGRLNSWNYWK